MSTYVSPTFQELFYRLARYVGVTSLLPQPYGSELEDVTYGLIADIANAFSAALQRIASDGPMEGREVPAGAFLNGPTQVTITATNGSKVISALTPWSSWMEGCTIRIFGDGQDNELLGQTQLVRPFMGSTGTLIQCTVYGDCLTQDNTVGKIVNPMYLGNRWILIPATNREMFLQLSLFPQVTFTTGLPAGIGVPNWGFPLFFQKTVGIPRTWFVDAAYDQSLGFTKRRIRFAPLPDQPYPVAYTVGVNPPRITVDDIVAPAYQSGANIVVTGVTGTTTANQTYAFLMNLGPQAIYQGITTPTWWIYPAPALSGNFVLAATVSLGTLPSAYWASGTNVIPNPTSNWTPIGTATGVAVVTPNFASVNTSDPGTLAPVPNAWVESILLPIALKYFSDTPLFKNDSLRPAIDENFKAALAALQNSKGQEALTEAIYV